MPRPFTWFVMVMALVVAALAAAIIMRGMGLDLSQTLSQALIQPLSLSGPDIGNERSVAAAARSHQQRSGSRYTPVPNATDPLDVYAAVTVESLDFDPFPRANALWGSSGRDDAGNLWFGVSARGASARLYQLFVGSGSWVDRGDVLSRLQATDEWRQGTSQAKIHSRIVQADDGGLYFASMDEHGERYLAGVVRSGHAYDWVVYDLQRGESHATPLNIPKLQNVALYGSITRDDQGRFYLVGRASRTGQRRKKGAPRFRPLVLRVDTVDSVGVDSAGAGAVGSPLTPPKGGALSPSKQRV